MSASSESCDMACLEVLIFLQLYLTSLKLFTEVVSVGLVCIVFLSAAWP